MPRIPHYLLLRGRKISPLIPLLLRTCRTLPSAQNELRWLREHVKGIYALNSHQSERARSYLLKLCVQRSRGVPLQYLLGSQPFGNLDILCRQGVLIPRPETEAHTIQFAKYLRRDGLLSSKRALRVLDLCTGSGCISLLLHSLLFRRYSDIQILGLDISDLALGLATENLKRNINLGCLNVHAAQQVSFNKADILQDEAHNDSLGQNSLQWDIVISNPPYISQGGFDLNVERSVRNWEPRLALVPPIVKMGNSSARNAEDIFYHKIFNIATAVSAQIVLMEVGDTEQALRVARMATDMERWSSIEIWKDWPDQLDDEIEHVLVGEKTIPMRGSGNGRSVVCRK